VAQMRVFVSHSHANIDFCQALVDGLKAAGADVWYDDENLHAGQLGPSSSASCAVWGATTKALAPLTRRCPSTRTAKWLGLPRRRAEEVERRARALGG